MPTPATTQLTPTLDNSLDRQKYHSFLKGEITLDCISLALVSVLTFLFFRASSLVFHRNSGVIILILLFCLWASDALQIWGISQVLSTDEDVQNNWVTVIREVILLQVFLESPVAAVEGWHAHLCGKDYRNRKDSWPGYLLASGAMLVGSTLVCTAVHLGFGPPMLAPIVSTVCGGIGVAGHCWVAWKSYKAYMKRINNLIAMRHFGVLSAVVEELGDAAGQWLASIGLFSLSAVSIPFQYVAVTSNNPSTVIACVSYMNICNAAAVVLWPILVMIGHAAVRRSLQQTLRDITCRPQPVEPRIYAVEFPPLSPEEAAMPVLPLPSLDPYPPLRSYYPPIAPLSARVGAPWHVVDAFCVLPLTPLSTAEPSPSESSQRSQRRREPQPLQEHASYPLRPYELSISNEQ